MATEVAGSPLPGHTVLCERHYEAGPPSNLDQEKILVDPENTYATTKEEEWVTKKKTELTTTRQIETRVKRQVVLEDGKVVGDSGPIVTTNTTEDTEKQEHQQTEHRTIGDDPPGKDWVAISGPDGLVKEVKEKKIISREEREERTETEDVQHLGDITDEVFQTAIQNKQDLRELIHSSSNHGELVSSSPKIIHQSSKTKKVVDTEDKQELSQLQEDGRLITETRRTTEHEEIHDKEEPDDEKGGESEEEETRRESSHRYAKTKDQDLVEYIADGVKIGEEMRYVAENIEGERHGDPADMDPQEWDSLSTRIRRMRRQGKGQRGGVGTPFGAAGPLPMDRKDALTKKPLDFDQEEETRKVETSKWLEHHFGSDSRSSKDSIDDDDIPVGGGSSTSYINVTMKSRPINGSTTVTSRVVTPMNGHQSPSPKGYIATVNTSSRVFVSSPEPEGAASGYFQGVSEWSERRNEIKENKTTFTPRVQVLPAGPNHTFISKTRADISSPHSSNNHLDRISPPHQNSNQSPYTNTVAYESQNFISTERNTHKYTNGRRSPYQQKTSGRASPYQYGKGLTRDSPVEEYHTRSSPYPNMERSASPYNHKPVHYNGISNGDVEIDHSPQPPYRRRHSERENDEHNYRYEKENGTLRRQKTEPPPDYSPPTNRATPSPSPSPERGTPPPDATPTSKKLYQRTRFAADIPPPPARQTPQTRAKSPGQSATSIIGESFRKFVGKFRSSSSERKNKRRSKRSSRPDPAPIEDQPANWSPSPRTSSTYQQYHVIDNNIPSVVGSGKSRVGRRGGEAAEAEAEGGESNEMQQPVAPPRSSRSVRTGMDRNYQRRGTSPVVQRFYLGEDPFGGSIYGREREYDGVTPVKSSRRHHKQNGYRRGSHGEEDDINRANVSSSTLGRLSKSTSRLTTGVGDPSLSRGAQTLPRKLYDERNERIKNQVYIQRSNGSTESSHWESSRLNRTNKAQPHSNSMINVSIINNVTPPTSSLGVNKPLSNGIGLTSLGPAKPARTYRSNLSRSKSFNVHAGSPEGPEPSSLLLGSRSRDTSTLFKSNPHLHRLDESPPPLKSPGILASISRSQRDLTASLDKDDIEEERHKFSKSTSNLISNGYSSSSQETKKKLFMKGLMERSPELYKTLHGNESPEPKPLSPSPVGRLYSSTPLKNGFTSNVSSSRVLDYSSSFKSSSTNNTPESDSLRSRPLSSPYRSSLLNGTDRVTSPVGNKPTFTTTLTHSPSFRDTNGTSYRDTNGTSYRDTNGTSYRDTNGTSYRDTNGTTTSIVRRGSIDKDDYSETVRITSKSDDPIRPSITNTVQSYSKKKVPVKGGLSTETIESSETTTVTKSRFRGGDSNQYSLRNGGGGGVVIEVRPTRR